MSPLVSVIVPNYNHSKFLRQRLDSILNQTYRNIELIIMDDCSADNSREIINQYRDNKLVSSIVFNDINSGSVFSQWEKGMSLAKGEIIWIAESDDYCEKDMLERLVNAYNFKKDTILSYAATVFVDENGNKTGRKIIFPNQHFEGKDFIRRYLTQGQYIYNASCAIFSKQAALSIPERYKEFKGAGDYMFFVELANKGSVAIVNRPLNYCRRHSSNVTGFQNSNGNNFINEKEILERINEISPLSKFRKYSAYAFHAKRIRATGFTDDETRKRIWDLWQVKKYSGIVSKSTTIIIKAIRLAFNVYL